MTTAGFKFAKPTPRRAPMKPGQQRRSYIRARRPRRLDTAQSNPAFLQWLHGEPCCAGDLGPCTGPIEAHHAGPKPGIAMKSPDATAVPICRGHHRAVTERRGPFAGKTREEMRATQDEWIAATWVRWLSHGSRRTG